MREKEDVRISRLQRGKKNNSTKCIKSEINECEKRNKL